MAAERGSKRGFLRTTLLAPVSLLLLIAIGGWLTVTLGGSGRVAWPIGAGALAVALLSVAYLLLTLTRLGGQAAGTEEAGSVQRAGATAAGPGPVDALTGLPSRPWFEQIFASEIERSHRYHRPLSLVILDVDHFTRVNRTHGQAVGDRILADFARILASSVRRSDHLARIADDEFAVLVCETPESGACSVAEKLRRTIEQQEFANGLYVSVSAGVATVEESDTVESFLHRGEAAAMTARRSGGNSVATATF